MSSLNPAVAVDLAGDQIDVPDEHCPRGDGELEPLVAAREHVGVTHADRPRAPRGRIVARRAGAPAAAAARRRRSRTARARCRAMRRGSHASESNERLVSSASCSAPTRAVQASLARSNVARPSPSSQIATATDWRTKSCSSTSDTRASIPTCCPPRVPQWRSAGARNQHISAITASEGHHQQVSWHQCDSRRRHGPAPESRRACDKPRLHRSNPAPRSGSVRHSPSSRVRPAHALVAGRRIFGQLRARAGLRARAAVSLPPSSSVSTHPRAPGCSRSRPPKLTSASWSVPSSPKSSRRSAASRAPSPC